MSFLAPLFLAGLAVLAAPVLAHLIRRSTRERFAFSAVRFLEDSAPRLDRRSRIQHPALLLLRIGIIALLALGFARPYFAPDAAPALVDRTPRHVVVLLDVSASMQRPALWDQALARVEETAQSLAGWDRLAVLTAAAAPRVVLSSTAWRDAAPDQRDGLLRTALSALAPGWQSARLDAGAERALQEWEEMANLDGGPGRRELVIVSDLAAGSRTGGLAELAWPVGSVVRLAPVTSPLTETAALHAVGWTTDPHGAPVLRVRVSRPFGVRAPLTWRWTEATTGRELAGLPSLDLLPGGQQVIDLPWPDPNVPALQLELAGDAVDFDNRLYAVRPVARTVRLVYGGSHDIEDPAQAGFYLARAVAGSTEPAVTFARELAATSGSRELIVLDGPVPAAEVANLRARLEAGANALWLHSAAAAAAANTGPVVEALTGETGWSAAPAPPGDALLGEIDFRHPLFAPFAEARYSNFARIRFWQPSPLNPPPDSGAHVAARFEDGSVAVTEFAVGAGRLVVWGGGWTPTESQWVLSSKFVPWLHALLERAAGGRRQPTMGTVDDGLRELATDGPGEPAGLSASTGRLTRPGVYQAGGGNGRLVALNVSPAESNLEPLGLDAWEQLGVPLVENAAPDPRALEAARRLTAASQEQQQQLWRLLLWAALIALGAESIVSRMLSRQAAAPAAV